MKNQNTPQPGLILASSSKYRKGLLQRLGLEFECESPNIDETPLDNEYPGDYVLRLARQKAQAIADKLPPEQSSDKTCVIIGSDQSAMLNQRFLAKPGSPDIAVKMLQSCSGQTVYFQCGWCVLHSKTGMVDQGIHTTEVAFRDLSYAEIERYTIAEPALDCAGAFKSESLGISLFRSIKSDDPTGLVGLPLIAISNALRSAGFQLP